jgi:hypothetical protein
MFLMHEILSVSALHLAHLKPNKSVIYRTAAATHDAAALLLFQPQLSNLTHENCNACFAFSALLSIHIWASQSPAEISNLVFSSESSENPDTPKITWFKLLRGSRAVIRAGWPWIEAGPLSPVFKPWKGHDTFDLPPPDPIETKHLDDLAEACNTRSAHQMPVPEKRKETLEMALRALRRVFSLSNYSPEISRHAATVSWMHLIQEEFVELIEAKVPEALLLVACYCVLLKRLQNMWWLEGKAESLLASVRAALGDGWERWLQWPIYEVFGTDIASGN